MKRAIRHGLVVLAGALAGGAGQAQTVEVPTHQAMTGVELTLTMTDRETGRALVRSTTRSATVEPLQIRLGTTVVVCFTASQTGWITLWSVDEQDRPARIYPNRFSHQDGENLTGAPVAEGVRYCLGDDARYNFTVAGRAGTLYDLSLNWTPSESNALPADAYVQIGARSTIPEGAARFAATHLSYTPTD